MSGLDDAKVLVLLFLWPAASLGLWLWPNVQLLLSTMTITVVSALPRNERVTGVQALFLHLQALAS